MTNKLKQLVCSHDRITDERDYVQCLECKKILVPTQPTILDRVINLVTGNSDDNNRPRMSF